jgi:threonine/homoserine/homoserine lactone efflux protein
VLVALLAFSGAAALIVLLPGPDTLVVLRSLLRYGRANAARTVAGVLTGLAVWVVAAALGLSAMLRASHDGYFALRCIGAAYLVWIGVQSLRARSKVGPGLDSDRRAGDGRRGIGELPAGEPRPAGGRRAGILGGGYPAGVATDLLNPKVGVFFVAFLPGFVPHGYALGPFTLLLGAIFIVETGLYFFVFLTASGAVTRWMSNPRIQRRIDRTTGFVLIGFGTRLVLESS